MHRRAGPPTAPLPSPAARIVRLAVALLLTFGVVLLDARPASAVTNPEPAPSTTINDFIPENENLSECIGVLERPGCGSRERGGWRQTAAFAVMLAGLVLVFGRIAWSVNRGRRG